MTRGLHPEAALWFLNGRVDIKIAAAAGADSISVLQYHAPSGDSPPLHIHETEDEVFHILEGELLFRVGDQEATASAGNTLLAPKGRAAHLSGGVAGRRPLADRRQGRGLRKLRARLQPPAEWDGLPDPAPAPTPEEAAALEEACRAHRIEIVGPPLDPKPSTSGA